MGARLQLLIKQVKCILFYKPYNVLCQFTDNDETTNRNTLKDYIAIPNIYPVGRLDLDSEGLLLLTDSGQLQHRLAHRKFAHPRTYWVQVERIPDDIALQKLRQGIKIKDYITRPAKVKLLPQPLLPPRNPPIRYRKNIPTSWLEITLTEGRNRQVRRMTAAVGFPTLRLVRVAMSIRVSARKNLYLRLDKLKPGEWRELNPEEQILLQKLVKKVK